MDNKENHRGAFYQTIKKQNKKPKKEKGEMSCLILVFWACLLSKCKFTYFLLQCSYFFLSSLSLFHARARRHLPTSTHMHTHFPINIYVPTFLSLLLPLLLPSYFFLMLLQLLLLLSCWPRPPLPMHPSLP